MRSAVAASIVTLLATSCTEPPRSSTPTPKETIVAARHAPPPAARSFRFSEPPRALEIAAPEAPMSLTASDGTGLAMVALRADAVVDDPLAFTQLHMTFENPEDRVIEGQFRITLPPGATVSRFAMLIGDEWQEGEVVELQAARRAYEDFLHRKQDPALLEQAAGNEFSARVFPIPARGRKQIILSYSQELVSAEETYRIPLRGLPKLGELTIRVFAGGALVAEEKQTGVVPADDFRVAAARPSGRLGLRHEELAVVRVTPPIEATPDEIDSLLVLVDTSASRALGFEEQARTVDDLIRALADGAGDVPVLVAAFDQDVETIHQGGARAFDAAALAKLIARKPLGASDLGAALRWAAGKRHDGGGYRRVVIVSDGVATAGDLDGEALRGHVKALAAGGVERLDAVVVGGIRDEERLGALVTAGLSRDGAVIDGNEGTQAIARRLTRRSRSGIEVAVDGAEWVWPRRLDAVQAGDQALIYARIAKERPLRVSLDGKPVELSDAGIAWVERPLLDRAAARAEIASMIAARDELPAEETKRREELKKRIIALSTSKRVLSPFTALLVLETAEDYVRFGIDRKALADILTVGDGGLAVRHRSEETLVVKKPRPPRKMTGGKDEAKKLKQDPSAAAEIEIEGQLALEKEEAEKAAMREEAVQKAEESGVLGAVRRDSADDIDLLLDGRRGGGESGGGGGQIVSGIDGDSSGVLGGAVGGDTATLPPPPPPPPRVASPTTTARPPDEAPRPEPASEPSPDPVADIPARSRTGETRNEARDERRGKNPYTGAFNEVMQLLRKQKVDDAVARAAAWRAESPGDVMALVALGEALEKQGDFRRAARAYGSLIDLFPQRADVRRFAGQRLERVTGEEALALAADTYAKAADQRADHPSSHRMLAFALVKLGRHEEAFAALERGLAQRYPEGRFAGVREILAEDLGLVAAAWIRVAPEKRSEIRARVKKAGGTIEDRPSLRFVLAWETDANDVDFHIHDAAGNHAFYSSPELASGGHLYADVTTGYGPECFTIRGARKGRAYPYRLEAHYYSRGPMGYGMGKLQIIDHDGAGTLRFEERPFVIMQDDAFVDLGTVRRAL